MIVVLVLVLLVVSSFLLNTGFEYQGKILVCVSTILLGIHRLITFSEEEKLSL
ncbi:hypothetical protein CANTEDRAFT_113568 [Yamadazyma tenuis ATCC 10573]|uniref:Uncharacterized protein n=1 Tax=Candida tenuis (strain ATCC 10573 / BCRC 21748 / CBS 615 / JCM 9827 / NBRC 10315 / NRRL Y-1498 / VKM Y-70) TaxID=590646 RepID=G3B0T4_CANTC|nr:uncharacterized protein CANTEDRAFT_113568 [Yamadazyma tenuis ATCC 10573]EGV64797.1 hypothetical protein CANTEDRAFT_113568 [Yamadazyma tenuis ATCC 10573]